MNANELLDKMETRETIGICRSPNVVKELNVHLENEEKIVKSSGAKMVVPYQKTFLDPLQSQC